MAGTQPNAERRRPMRTVSLSDEEWERLTLMAKRLGMTRSRLIAKLVNDAIMPQAPKRAR